MSLNAIDLGEKMLTDLYGKVLVGEQAIHTGVQKPPPPVPDQTGPVRFLGKNSKNYCFLVSYPNETFIPDDKMEVLIKIMQACKISMDDIALVNIAGSKLTVEELRSALLPQKMVLLGVNPADIRLPIHFPVYKPQAYAGCTYLHSESLDSMDNSDSGRKAKTSLWTSLKEMFSL